jgi:hypothetical protein
MFRGDFVAMPEVDGAGFRDNSKCLAARHRQAARHAVVLLGGASVCFGLVVLESRKDCS